MKNPGWQPGADFRTMETQEHTSTTPQGPTPRATKFPVDRKISAHSEFYRHMESVRRKWLDQARGETGPEK
jgi:hypothetical protein